jgi:hypothetical protein
MLKRRRRRLDVEKLRGYGLVRRLEPAKRRSGSLTLLQMLELRFAGSSLQSV